MNANLNNLGDTAALLSRASYDKGISQSLLRVHYPDALARDRLQFPEHLVSLYHHPVYATLSDQQRWRLGLLETVNFFSLNIHGERSLVRDLVLRCHRSTALGNSPVVHEYLQHFIHEENAHTFMLAGYCHRYGDGVSADTGMRVAEPQLSAAGQELLSFGRTFMLESFLDYLNREAMRDDTLDPTARQIHRIHHLDEARHMAFDKAVIRTALDQLRVPQADTDPEICAAELATISGLIHAYGDHARRRLKSAAIYRSIGLPDPMQLCWALDESPQRQAVEAAWLSAGTAFFNNLGLARHPAPAP